MEDIRRFLGDRDLETADRICELFREVDAAANSFRTLTHIRCPEGCGECCSRAQVQTTAVEMLPLAVELWRRNEAEFWLDRIAESVGKRTCVFYREDPGTTLSGRCMVYEMRPLICRLFGFFTVRDKNGRYVYGSCRIIKEKDPATYEKAVQLLSEMEHPSMYTDYSIRIIGIDSSFGFRMEPINNAAAIALYKIGYRLDLTGFGKKVS